MCTGTASKLEKALPATLQEARLSGVCKSVPSGAEERRQMLVLYEFYLSTHTSLTPWLSDLPLSTLTTFWSTGKKKRYNLISPMIMTANSQELHIDHDLKKKQLRKYWKWITVVETSLLTPWEKGWLSEFHVWFLCWPKTMTGGKHLSFSTIHLEEKD